MGGGGGRGMRDTNDRQHVFRDSLVNYWVVYQ